MRYCHSVKSVFIKLFCACLLLFAGGHLSAQVPARPVPPRLVNDLASVLTVEQSMALERKLVAFADSSSNQIAVVIVPELYGMDKASLAFELGEKWGVGHEKYNNGVVILVKPKTATERGEAFIATGYGLEGILPDALARTVVDNEMIPYFKNNNYYGGINSAVEELMPLLSGEISSDEFANRYGGGDNLIATVIGILFIGFILLCIVVAIFGKDENNMGGNGRGGGRKGPNALDLLLLGSILSNSGSRSSGGFGGGFGSGSGGFGGFGGFGGGHFGGGGAGGSW